MPKVTLNRVLRRRSPEETERELRKGSDMTVPPGGAEGGDESPAADTLGALPADDGAPLGDTDQHSSSRPAQFGERD